jgi:hypothetical protein
MARDEQMDCRICERLCNMSAKQNHDSSNENPTILNHHKRGNTPLQANCNGPNYRPL